MDVTTRKPKLVRQTGGLWDGFEGSPLMTSTKGFANEDYYELPSTYFPTTLATSQPPFLDGRFAHHSIFQTKAEAVYVLNLLSAFLGNGGDLAWVMLGGFLTVKDHSCIQHYCLLQFQYGAICSLLSVSGRVPFLM